MQTRLAKLAPSERNDVFQRSDFAGNDLKDGIDSDSSLFSGNHIIMYILY